MKKGNLWIFGDSYATIPKDDFEKNKNWYWIPSLTDRLGHINFYNIAQNGVANEWSYYSFVNNLNLINPKEDTIIFIITQIERQWFFSDNVGASNHYMSGIENYVDKNQATAIKYYQKYLSDNPQDIIRAQCLVYALAFIKLKQNLNLTLLPGFREPDIDYGDNKGCLFDICINEVKGNNITAWSNWLTNSKNAGRDPRVGHLSKPNHIILTDKLYNSISNKSLLDLSTGFEQGIYNV